MNRLECFGTSELHLMPSIKALLRVLHRIYTRKGKRGWGIWFPWCRHLDCVSCGKLYTHWCATAGVVKCHWIKCYFIRLCPYIWQQRGKNMISVFGPHFLLPHIFRFKYRCFFSRKIWELHKGHLHNRLHPKLCKQTLYTSTFPQHKYWLWNFTRKQH